MLGASMLWGSRALAEQPPPGVWTNVAEGFGRSARGGAGGAVYHVTSLADAGPGSLREGAEGPETLTIVFDVSGEIRLTEHLAVGPHKTINGRGADVTISGRGFILRHSDVVIRNLAFRDFHGDEPEDIEDGILLNGANNVWIDHCDFADAGDKAIGAPASTRVTISWNHFVDQTQVVQIGSFGTAEESAKARFTLHHNFFDRTGYRQPRISYGRAHAFNNYLTNWTVHGMSSIRSAELASEANIFEAGSDKDAIVFDAPEDTDKDPSPGFVRSSSDLLLNGARARQNKPGKVFDPDAYYESHVSAASPDLAREIERWAGRLDEPA
jgi:pectate lyase